jgi:TetR/AcrR family transcriptional regulator, fatty acid metabolism regulator protein
MKPHSSTPPRAPASPDSSEPASEGPGEPRRAGAERAGDKNGGGGDKRERILDAAERVFARQGFYQSRVSEIARDAGVADGTIYLYFKSKDDLLISLFESRMERVNQRMATALANQVTPTDRLMALVRTHLGLVHDNPQLAEVLTIELRQSTKFMKEYANPRFGEFLKLVASVIAEGQESGEFALAVPAPHAARMIFGIIDELALAWLLGGRGENLDLTQAAEWVGMLVLQGLKPRAEASYPSAVPAKSPEPRRNRAGARPGNKDVDPG